MVKRKALTFILKGIDPDEIDKKYKIVMSSNIEKTAIIQPRNTTKVDDIFNKNNRVYSFYDETKLNHNCFITMQDHLGNVLPKITTMHCWWCRNQFDTTPIGCPVNYIPTQVEKRYYSEISHEYRTVKESISRQRLEQINSENRLDTGNKKTTYMILDGDYYLVDGLFCSFNCCQAYVNDNRHNSMYDKSTSLLLKMYSDVYREDIDRIVPSPSWKILTQYGGHLTIQQYRDSLSNRQYIEHGVITVPVQRPVATLLEEKINM